MLTTMHLTTQSRIELFDLGFCSARQQNLLKTGLMSNCSIWQLNQETVRVPLCALKQHSVPLYDDT